LREAARKANDPSAAAAQDLLKRLEGRRLSDADVGVILETLNGLDHNRSNEAIKRLAEAEADSRHRAAVVKALGAVARDRDGFRQGEVLRALRVWADRATAQPLIDRGTDKSFEWWRQALEVLVHIDPSPHTAEILIARWPEDDGHITRLLREIGPTAEPTLLQAFQQAPDPRVRAAAGRLLEAIGSEAALPALQAAATGIGDGMVAREAEETLKIIRERES
jgi:HEAT repeat protein